MYLKGEGEEYERSGFDPALRFSLFLIKTDSQKFSKCLKNGSDRLRKGQLLLSHSQTNHGLFAYGLLPLYHSVQSCSLQRQSVTTYIVSNPPNRLNVPSAIVRRLL